jgi:hypothetical protein
MNIDVVAEPHRHESPDTGRRPHRAA